MKSWTFFLFSAGASLAMAADPTAPRIPPRADAVPAFFPANFSIEVQTEADLNADGLDDSIAVVKSEDLRYLLVALREGKGLRRIRLGELDAYPLGNADLKVSAKKTLVLTDLTGGTSAFQTVYRYRYESAADRMRLIGLDVDFYSRTNAHGGLRRSYNYLTGETVGQDSTLDAKGEYRFGKEQRHRGAPQTIYLEDTPDPADLVSGDRP